VTGFADPALERLWRAAHAGRERRGASGSARIVLKALGRDEAFALDGLPWAASRKPVLAGETFATTLTALSDVVGLAGGNLDAILTEVVGAPPRDLPAESRAKRDQRAAFHAWLDDHPVVSAHPGLGDWARHVRRVGAPGPGQQALVATALAVIGALPRSPPLARSTLAAQLLEGDAHGLDADAPLGRLCATLLSWRRGSGDRPLDPIETRDLWSALGVEIDPLSCSVLTLGLTLTGETSVAGALRALRGRAVVLTYAQLCEEPPDWPSGAPAFTCENPVVIRAAELELGRSSPPLICTAGWPNAAVLALLDRVRRSGGAIRHHGDDDAAGDAILAYLGERVGALPWRPRERAEPPAGAPPSARAPGGSLPEELVLDELLGDLARMGRHDRHSAR
jgi:uncharacterized protein (TIGR02679 family)